MLADDAAFVLWSRRRRDTARRGWQAIDALNRGNFECGGRHGALVHKVQLGLCVTHVKQPNNGALALAPSLKAGIEAVARAACPSPAAPSRRLTRRVSHRSAVR